jgi:DNA-binding beta-propeller fold protein YncE
MLEIPVRRRCCGWWLAIAIVFLLAPASRAIDPLAQLPGTAGCINETGGDCVLGRELDGAIDVAVSPDSRNVYVASSIKSAVAVFDIDPATGGLTQKAGQDACVSESGSLGACEDGRALQQVRGIAVSPDGRNVYAASLGSDAVLIFDRNPDTGAIDQKAGLAGCISQSGTGGACTQSVGLDEAQDVTVTPDGRQVVVAGTVSNSLVTFERDPMTGALTPFECFTAGGTEGCTSAIAISGAAGVAVSPDGRNVYVASQSSNAIARFDRNPSDGSVTQPGDATACVAETGDGVTCEDGEALTGAFRVAVSPNGRNVYAVARIDDSVLVFDRDPGAGTIVQAAGTDGCTSSSDPDCAVGTALDDPFGLAVSPDGESVFVAGSSSSAVAVFDRKLNNGLLAQKTGTAGCWAENGGSCADGRGLTAVASVAASPDGRTVYAASFTSDAVATFDRAVPAYDLDGDGQLDALTDGLLLLRYLFGFSGAALVTGAVDLANCTRCTAATIAPYIESLASP